MRLIRCFPRSIKCVYTVKKKQSVNFRNTCVHIKHDYCRSSQGVGRILCDKKAVQWVVL